jgi:hypothetical protein
LSLSSYVLHSFIKYNLLEQGARRQKKKQRMGKKEFFTSGERGENQERRTGKEERNRKDPFVAASKRSWFKEASET